MQRRTLLKAAVFWMLAPLVKWVDAGSRPLFPVVQFDGDGYITNIEDLLGNVPWELTGEGMNQLHICRKAVVWLPLENAVRRGNTGRRNEFHVHWGEMLLQQWFAGHAIITHIAPIPARSNSKAVRLPQYYNDVRIVWPSRGFADRCIEEIVARYP